MVFSLLSFLCGFYLSSLSFFTLFSLPAYIDLFSWQSFCTQLFATEFLPYLSSILTQALLSSPLKAFFLSHVPPTLLFNINFLSFHSMFWSCLFFNIALLTFSFRLFIFSAFLSSFYLQTNILQYFLCKLFSAIFLSPSISTSFSGVCSTLFPPPPLVSFLFWRSFWGRVLVIDFAFPSFLVSTLCHPDLLVPVADFPVNFSSPCTAYSIL